MGSFGGCTCSARSKYPFNKKARFDKGKKDCVFVRGEMLNSPSSDYLSLSSSHKEVSLTQTRIVKRNLWTDFLEATSLPVNVPIHRHLEAISPGTPMRWELSRCEKELPPRLAKNLCLPAPSLPSDAPWEDLVFDLELGD